MREEVCVCDRESVIECTRVYGERKRERERDGDERHKGLHHSALPQQLTFLDNLLTCSNFLDKAPTMVNKHL